MNEISSKLSKLKPSNSIIYERLGRHKSKIYRSIDRGDNVYILSDNGILPEVCDVLWRSGYGILKMRGYYKEKDDEQFDWYLQFSKDGDDPKDFIYFIKSCNETDARLHG